MTIIYKKKSIYFGDITTNGTSCIKNIVNFCMYICIHVYEYVRPIKMS